MFVQVAYVRVATQEPQQLVDDRLQVDLLRGHQWKALGQIKSHLMTEDTSCAGPCAVAFRDAGIDDFLKQIEILSHAQIVSQGREQRTGPAKRCRSAELSRRGPNYYGVILSPSSSP